MKQSTLIPELLLADRTIDPLAKLLYVVTEVYRPASLTALAKITGLSCAFTASPLKGEFLLRKWLDHLILSEDYMDNARPAFLQNPNVAEFNDLRSHDLMKMGLCSENGVTLVIVTAEDLSLERLLGAIPDFAPKRQVDANGPYIKALERLSTEYKASMARIMVKEVVPVRAQTQTR